MQKLIVTDAPGLWKIELPDTTITSPSDYIHSEIWSEQKQIKVVNLCKSYQYQSIGYYISLLAEARGHKVIPATATMMDFKMPGLAREDAQDFDTIIQDVLEKYTREDKLELNIYFGFTTQNQLAKIGSLLFNLFQTPIHKAVFQKKERWQLVSLKSLNIKDLTEDQRGELQKALVLFLSGKAVVRKNYRRKKYDLAILVNPEEATPPSDPKALQKFVKAADKVGFNTEFITKADGPKITHFDALFIRETTNVNHHTFKLARKADYEGLAVIDDPASILKCTNKVYLKELLDANNIAAPRSIIIDKTTASQVESTIPFPIVLKQPDGSFSKGVKKARDKGELDLHLKSLFQQTDLIIAQEFMPTDFDWRVGVIGGKIIYICKYFMARNHWQIVDWKSDKTTRLGKSEAVAIDQAPKGLVRLALRATKLIGNGLYGVDIKESKGKFYIIEINDNPSIESTIEDKLEKSNLYESIMKHLMQMVLQ